MIGSAAAFNGEDMREPDRYSYEPARIPDNDTLLGRQYNTLLQLFRPHFRVPEVGGPW